MTDEQLEHHCRLSVIAISGLRDPTWVAQIAEASHSELHDQHTCLQILADTCVELMRRQGIKPRLQMYALTRPSVAGGVPVQGGEDV